MRAPEDRPPVSVGPPSRGMRFSILDGVVLVLGSAATWLLWRLIGHFALLLPVTLVHFLLFCNVFRIRRGSELLWAGTFVLNFGSWVFSGSFSWWPVLAIQTAITGAILFVEIRHPRYHGVFCKGVEP